MIATARLTGEKFDALPYEEGRRWELLDGELIEVSSAALRHQQIVSILLTSLCNYLLNTNIGGVFPDVEFALDHNTRLRPDLAVILHEKWRSLDLDRNPAPLAPDIAVEIISPSERPLESARKVKRYLELGVTEVWQLLPAIGEAQIHLLGRAPVILGLEDSLATPMLPGWEVKLRAMLPV